MSNDERRRPGLVARVSLFAAAWVLLGWPLVSLAEDASGRSMFWYLFGVGALLVALLFAQARALSGGRGGGRE